MFQYHIIIIYLYNSLLTYICNSDARPEWRDHGADSTLPHSLPGPLVCMWFVQN